MALIQDSTNPRFLSQGAISPEDLTRTSELPIEKPNPTGVYNVGSIADVPLQATASEQKMSGLSEQLKELYGSQVGRSALQTSANRQFGVDTARQGINDLTAQLQGLRAEALAIPLNLQNQSAGITTGVLNTMTDAQLRTNAVKALNVQSLLAASQGQLANAQALADQAVAQKFDPIKEEIDAIERQLEIIKADPNTTREQQNRADRQRALQEERKRQLETDEANEKEVYNIGLTALKYGADIQTVQRIQQAKTPQEAIAIGGAALQDPKAKLELESSRLDILYKQAQIRKLQSDIIREAGERTKAEQKLLDEQKKAADLAKAQLPGLGDKMTLIDSLTSSKGLNAAVGTNPLARISVVAGLSGAKQDFIAGVQQLTSKDTLDALINLKAAGGTLGALSDGERQTLQQAAGKIATWAIKDKDGNVTGYNASESSFKRELERIKELTQRAITNAGANVIDTDEKETLNAFFGASTGASTNLAPANYY